MEYYHYVNIFETKGLEYILVICFLVTFVLFVRRLEAPPRRGGSGPGNVIASTPGGPVTVAPEDTPTPGSPGGSGSDGSHPRRE